MERPKPAEGDSYVCPGTARCGQICRGLGRQGWKMAANLGEPGKCQTPQYLMLDDNGKSRIPGLDGELPDRLAQGLADYLHEYYAEEGPERSARLEIKTGFQAVQAARNELYQNMLAAIKDGGLAPEEINFYQDQIEKAKQNLQEITGKYELEDAMLGRAAFDRQCLDEYGVIFTDDMLAHVERLINNAATGCPSMLQGDKGIAKTQVVKYISQLIAPNKPSLIVSMAIPWRIRLLASKIRTKRRGELCGKIQSWQWRRARVVQCCLTRRTLATRQYWQHCMTCYC